MLSRTRSWTAVAVVTFALGGCADAEDPDPGPSGGDPAGDTAMGDPTAGDPGTGDTAMGDPSTGDPSAGDPAMGDSFGDAMGDSATAGLEAHGCTLATATDRTGLATVIITDISAWSIGHNACILVDAGTTVQWNGSFTAHPLAGGVSPTTDSSSPITVAGPGSGTTPVTVTLSSAGDFPYFCTIHLSSMAGVVYVR